MFNCQEGASQGPSRSSRTPGSHLVAMHRSSRPEKAGTADGVGARGAWLAKGGGRSGSDSKGRGQEGHGLQGAWAGRSDSRGRGPAGYRQQGTWAGGARAARDVDRRGMSCRRLGRGWARAARGVGRRGADPTDRNLF